MAMVGRLGWYDSQYPVALSACLGGKGVRSEATVSRSRRELSNEYLLAKFGFDTAENEPCKVCPLSAYRSPRYAKRAFVHHYVGEGMEEGLLFLPTFEYD